MRNNPNDRSSHESDSFECSLANALSCNMKNKIIARMVIIRPLDDRTYCARSAFTDKSCTIVRGITSQPADVFSNVPY